MGYNYYKNRYDLVREEAIKKLIEDTPLAELGRLRKKKLENINMDVLKPV